MTIQQTRMIEINYTFECECGEVLKMELLGPDLTVLAHECGHIWVLNPKLYLLDPSTLEELEDRLEEVSDV